MQTLIAAYQAEPSLQIVTDFIFDYSKRFGLTVQEERISDIKEED